MATMNTNLERIDEVISELKSCKNSLQNAIIDNNDSVSDLIKKIDAMISQLQNSRAAMSRNITNMLNKKVWR